MSRPLRVLQPPPSIRSYLTLHLDKPGGNGYCFRRNCAHCCQADCGSQNGSPVDRLRLSKVSSGLCLHLDVRRLLSLRTLYDVLGTDSIQLKHNQSGRSIEIASASVRTGLSAELLLGSPIRVSAFVVPALVLFLSSRCRLTHIAYKLEVTQYA